MISRLAAESTVKVPLRGQPYFSVSKKLLCFQTDTHIRIKAVSRQAKDIQIPFNNLPIHFSLSQQHPWLYQLTHNNLLQIYRIEYINGLADGSFKKIGIIHSVLKYEQIKNGLILLTKNFTIKTITFKQLAESTEINLNIEGNSLKSITQASGPFVWTVSPDSERIVITRCKEQQVESAIQPVTEIFDRVANTLQYQKTHSFTFLNRIIAIYQDRFAFQRKTNKEIQIYDLEQLKLIGKIALEDTIKFSSVKHNLLLIITSKQKVDYLNFFVLNSQSKNMQPLVVNRAIYQKTNGDFYSFHNYHINDANIILGGKKNTDIVDAPFAKITDGTASVLYALNKTKEKVEMIKVEHSKVLKYSFAQQKLDKIVYSNKSIPSQSVVQEKVQIEKERVNSAIQSKSSESIQQLQKKFVNTLIDIKLKGVIKKFQQLQKRVLNLQRLIKGINQKVETHLSKINRQEIKQNVDKLFDNLTPQFQKYFNEIFKQVAGVLDQGVTYYNAKLAKQAEFHKEALKEIVAQTFKGTEEIVKIGKKEEKISEKTEEHLRRILDSKKKWTKTTEEYQSKIKQVPTPNLKGGQGESKVEGKVFVRADLNYPNSKRQG